MSEKLTTQDRVMLLMTLVAYLHEGGERMVSELADTFAVDARTLRGLVQFIGVAGVPGETRTYQHEDLFDIDWDALEQHDIVRLTQVVAVDDTPRFSSAETAALIAGLHALTPMLPEEKRLVAEETAKKLASAVNSDQPHATVSVTAGEASEGLREVFRALEQQLLLRFTYRDASEALTKRTVRPLELSQSGDTWYLRAYCFDRLAERTFIVDRIRDALAYEQGAEVAPEAGGASSSSGSLFTRGEQPADQLEVPSSDSCTAVVKLKQSALHRIMDFSPRVIAQIDDAWVRAEVDLRHPAVAVRLVQAAPDSLIVELPAPAVTAVTEWAERALAAYDA